MKNKFLHGAAALALCSGFVACSEYDAGVAPETLADIKSLQYETAFVQKFGKIDPAQDWGFGSGAETRATETWTNNHSCTWDSKFTFTVPDDAIDLTNLPTNADKDGKISGAVYVIPEDFEGELNLGYNVKFNNSVIYNLGKVTNIINVNIEGELTFYNVGEDAEMTWTITSGQKHTIINTGTFILANDANISTVYNNHVLIITDTDILNSVTINSTCDVEMQNGGDFKAECDIHGTLVSDKDIKVQNSNTQYICAIKTLGTLDLTQGKLETSSIEASHIKFDGDQLWLLPGGHVTANSIEVPNGGCYVFGEKTSNALIEVGNVTFGNDNDFDRTFSDNIYFLVTGYIDCSGATNLPGGDSNKKKYNSATEYLNQIKSPLGRLFETKEAFEALGVSGSPACGAPWGKTTTTTKTLKESGRVFCEDLGSIGDFDFNDVVFDAYVYSDGSAKIVLWAAGGTLPITVAGFDPHSELGSGMVNTGVTTGKKVSYEFEKPAGSYSCINDIPVVVRQNDNAGYEQQILLKSAIGEAPQKICVPLDTRWMREYEQINDGYTLFEDWVRGNVTTETTFKQNSSTTNTSYLY